MSGFLMSGQEEVNVSCGWGWSQDHSCPSAHPLLVPLPSSSPFCQLTSSPPSFLIQGPRLFTIPKDSFVFFHYKHIPHKCRSTPPEAYLVPSGNSTSILPSTPLWRCICSEPQGRQLSSAFSGERMVKGSHPLASWRKAERGLNFLHWSGCEQNVHEQLVQQAWTKPVLVIPPERTWPIRTEQLRLAVVSARSHFFPLLHANHFHQVLPTPCCFSTMPS